MHRTLLLSKDGRRGQRRAEQGDLSENSDDSRYNKTSETAMAKHEVPWPTDTKRLDESSRSGSAPGGAEDGIGDGRDQDEATQRKGKWAQSQLFPCVAHELHSDTLGGELGWAGREEEACG